MKNYLLPEDLRTALMDCLKAQPYGAVAEGMKALEGLTQLPEAEHEPEPAPEPLRSVPDPLAR